MKYSDKLKDPRWQKKRLEIFERDNWACVLCCDHESTLNVHHVEYIKNKEPWDYDDKYLWTLCNKCHDIEGLYKSKIKDILHDMRITGLSNYQIALFLAQGFSKYRRNQFMESLSVDGERNDLI